VLTIARTASRVVPASKPQVVYPHYDSDVKPPALAVIAALNQLASGFKRTDHDSAENESIAKKFVLWCCD
jgi:hypothetical protein